MNDPRVKFKGHVPTFDMKQLCKGHLKIVNTIPSSSMQNLKKVQNFGLDFSRIYSNLFKGLNIDFVLFSKIQNLILKNS